MELKYQLGIAYCLLPVSLTNISELYAATQFELSPPLLLAKQFEPSINLQNYLVSEKLDGIRAYWDGEQFLTRSGRTIHTPDWFTEKFPKIAIDGELWLGRQQFEKISGIVRRKTIVEKDWKHIKYMAFDLPKELATFEFRLNKLKSLVKDSRSQYLAVVPQKIISSRAELDNALAVVIAKGGEGLMLHKRDSLYQAKRSYDLQKLKPFDDAEAEVLAHIPGKGKYQGLLGAIEVVNQDGIRFKIGSGFSLNERQTPPPVGSKVTYRFRGKTKNNTPRFATYLRRYNE
ncbi:DNA ligase [Aliikangiella coralliicola]|uniref:DNA ligase n=1 Tax=Aliikangiella coralliicola TaxID=2592383 RepID=A0A545UK62_9GAMM|nr:DNA ligase [Aliikangiella coralliicola]TQV89849.1 DNA ligase [Aliikangiella coralliicola]